MNIIEYFNILESELEKAIEIANKARLRGSDPEPQIEIPIAKDLADRVEKLMQVEGVAKRLRELEKTMSREEAALYIATDIATEKIKKFPSKEAAIEAAIRTAMAVITEGVVAAPIEGIANIELAKNDDGSEYIRIYYAGPVRSAGGTAQALSVLAADYIRLKLGINKYIPRTEEIERYVEEISAYRKVANLQYLPSDDEIRLIVKNCPICIDGEPTEEEEVESRRDLERIESNRIRGGVALVICEGIALKAPKVKKYVDKLKLKGWDWLDKFIVSVNNDDSSSVQIKPKDKFMQDIIAGRPVFSYPSRIGGFRLRYGRSRNTGFAAAGISPATMRIMSDFIATGTQLKIERPGKAAAIGPVDSIEGPTVCLYNGDVLRVDSEKKAIEIRKSIKKILDIGEILINYGDFLENNHPLLPASYCFEWWEQELFEKASKESLKNINLENPDEKTALYLSEKYGVPLHPKYTYLWHDITIKEYENLVEYIEKYGKYSDELSIPLNKEIKEILETLLIPHIVRENNIIIKQALVLLRCLSLDTNLKKTKDVVSSDILSMVSKASEIKIRKKAPHRIGARMGRPEKSDNRKMKPAPHLLFPIGKAGGTKRSLNTAKEYTDQDNNVKIGLSTQKGKKGLIKVQIGKRICKTCKKITFKNKCECGDFTKPVLRCVSCGIEVESDICPKCKKETTSITDMEIDIKSEFKQALENLGIRDNIESIKGVKGLTSKHATPEPIEKGILRAKNDIVVFKDGTVRYDLSDMPLTHFRPDEIGVSIDKLKKLGYDKDIYGKTLINNKQILELKIQDIILSYDCRDYLFKIGKFIDELLTKYYKIDSYYNLKSKDDLIGVLVIGLAPHTSAGVVGRIIGFTKASVGYAHPFFHAAKRRNCDGDEDCVMLLMDGLLNFSKWFLPDKRGGQMDAPLVLTSRIDPNEIDKESHNIDVLYKYPLEFYEATVNFKNPKDIVDIMDTVSGRLGTPKQYQGFGFTHDTSDIAAGPENSSYKTIGTMFDKLTAQLELAKKIKAVDEDDVAERVIKSHFLPDLIGNLRSFSKQKFRCNKCGAKFRRPPIQGKCLICKNEIILTVHVGSVKKYLDISLELSKKYKISKYTKQRIELLDIEMESLFENEKIKQKGLSDFL